MSFIMKKLKSFFSIKKIVLILIVISVISILFGYVDYDKVVNKREKPIFCVGYELKKDYGSGTYIGLGYAFNIEGNFMPEEKDKGVKEYEFYILGIRIA